MTLHQVFTHPNQHPSLDDCCQAGDALLLLQDAVYAATQELTLMSLPGLKLYALENDILARGISIANPQISVINDQQWLALCLEHHKVISWN